MNGQFISSDHKLIYSVIYRKENKKVKWNYRRMRSVLPSGWHFRFVSSESYRVDVQKENSMPA